MAAELRASPQHRNSTTAGQTTAERCHLLAEKHNTSVITSYMAS